jgi:hypothetical protein
MKVEKFFYTLESGWSVSEFPRLDSDQTLIVVFGSYEFIDNQEVIKEN